MACAIALKRQLGLTDFKIFEKAADIGGTWRDNIYPGASSDSAIHYYSLPSDLSADWPSTHGSQPDTLAYWKKLAEKYNLYEHIAFNHLVISAEWDSEHNLYHVVTQDALGIKSSTTAKILISALGILEVPRYPDIAGVESFRGEHFHSARWDTRVALSGKRVAVIGNGASATQFVPIISRDPTTQVTQFCRTANWYLPNIRSDFSPWAKWVFKNVPFALRFNWWFEWAWHSTGFPLSVRFSRRSLLDRVKVTAVESHMTKNAPKECLSQIIPQYPPGCKRMLLDTDYLSALHRPNMFLNWDGIQSIYEHGIVTKTGQKLPLDVIIFATGFVTDRFPLAVRGVDGETIQDYYDIQGGPKAYISTTVPGFPNFFMLAGPNTATGHNSVIYTESLQINYVMRFIQPIIAGVVSTFEVTRAATDLYNDKIQQMLARSVHTSCMSWYRVGGTGRIANIFPGPGTLLWMWTRRPKWEDYRVVVGTKKGERSRPVQRERIARFIARLGLLTLAVTVGIAFTGSLGRRCALDLLSRMLAGGLNSKLFF
ncbi:hypothetical protein FB45DRAFT_760152 [Roridomyces roridus]|uniref:Uncharacterized protein n=1 Tax=Roridomyces roridus TaxID=1738132 RepID=A0AAD7B6N0_9AGAR|nr:hypothetical protein FB45DRAFT_760152 [Roridomyces roridus]